MRKHRTPEQWQVLVEQQRDSGLSAMQFCKQETIGYASFCNWRKRLSDVSVHSKTSCHPSKFHPTVTSHFPTRGYPYEEASHPGTVASLG